MRKIDYLKKHCKLRRKIKGNDSEVFCLVGVDDKGFAVQKVEAVSALTCLSRRAQHRIQQKEGGAQ